MKKKNKITLTLFFSLLVSLGFSQTVIITDTLIGCLDVGTVGTIFIQDLHANGAQIKGCADSIIIQGTSTFGLGGLDLDVSCNITEDSLLPCSSGSITINRLADITECSNQGLVRLNINNFVIPQAGDQITNTDWYRRDSPSSISLVQSTPGASETCVDPDIPYWIAVATITSLDDSQCILESPILDISCEDTQAPGIVGLSDPCISDIEWATHYSTFTDSASFFLSSNFQYYELYSQLEAIDDCEVVNLWLRELTITPPGGVSRPPGGSREFAMRFKALDSAGRSTNKTITWTRQSNSVCGQ